MSYSDTIAAIATPHGMGGIGIIRISGNLAHSIARTICHLELKAKSPQFCRFYTSQSEILDHGIALYFPGPHSFTGEDVVELQGHGSPVVQDMLIHQIVALGARIANPGEFSQRAFLNNKIDLAQAESIADLIESGSQAAAKAAMRSLEGKFSSRVNALKDEIIYLRTYIEAALDFAEEEIDYLSDTEVEKNFSSIIKKLTELLRNAENGRQLNEGMTLAIAGLPNAGKSSLLNLLSGYEVAIVTDIAGTTRDVIRENINLNGIPIRILDTAGLRETDEEIEKEGIKRAQQEIEKADLVLYVIDASVGKQDADKKYLQHFTEKNLKVLNVYNKVDLVASGENINENEVHISAKHHKGIQQLIEKVSGSQNLDTSNQTILARRRHIEALQKTIEFVDCANQSYIKTKNGELIAEDLRLAQKYLNEITGEFNTEDLLGNIFSSFCIGK